MTRFLRRLDPFVRTPDSIPAGSGRDSPGGMSMPRVLKWLWVVCALFCASILLVSGSVSADDWGGGWDDDFAAESAPEVVEEPAADPAPPEPAPVEEEAAPDPVDDPAPAADAWDEPEEPAAPVMEDDTWDEPEEPAAPAEEPEEVEEEPVPEVPAAPEEVDTPVEDVDEPEEAPAVPDADGEEEDKGSLVPPETMQELDEEVRDDVRTIMLTHDHALRTQARDHLIGMGVDGIPGAMMLVKDKMQLSRIFGVVILREIAVNTGGQGAAGQIPGYLLKLLDDHDPMVRHNASMALRKITGQFFDFHYNAPESQRRQAIARWHRYLLDQGMIRAGE